MKRSKNIFDRFTWLIVVCLMSCTQIKVPPKRLSGQGRLQLEIARMHFDNGDYSEARAEYIRLALNYPSKFVSEWAHFRIGETFFHEGDYPQAIRYFSGYMQLFPNGFKRQESDVRLSECQSKLEKSKFAWSHGYKAQMEARLEAAEAASLKEELGSKRQELPPMSFSDKVESSLKSGVKVTYYWVVDETRFAAKDFVDVIDVTGNRLTKVPQAFYKRLLVEGTGKLRDGRVLNWAAPGRFTFTEAPYGLGVRNFWLEPLKSIAVDPKQIPIGSAVFVAAFSGLRLPGGKRHNGCFKAVDVGGAIKDAHIDVFASDYETALFLMRQVPEKVTVAIGDRRCI